MLKNSYLSPKCEAKTKSAIKGHGVFAKEDIRKGEVLTVWGGSVITTNQMATLPKELLEEEYPVQVYDGVYLGPVKVDEIDDAEMFNHSCMPNAGIKGSIILVARRDIKKGEEICFDYETTDIQGLKNFTCQCGTVACRKKITGNAWKNRAFQKQNEGYFSWYIEEKIKKERLHHWFSKKPRFFNGVTSTQN